jgi:hypothetical protein
MEAYERSLVERYAGKPFVVLGVNRDADRAILTRVQQRDRIPWPSVWDEDGRIASRWGVQGLPAVFLLDAQGVIRFQSVGPPAHEKLEAKVDELLTARGERGVSTP